MVSRSSSKEGEDADAGVPGAEQHMAAQQETEQTPVEEEMPVSPQQDRGIKQERQGHKE